MGKNKARLYVLIFMMICSTLGLGASSPAVHAAAGDGTLTDSNIQYVGRWDKSSSSEYVSHWSGAYLRTNFTGQHISAVFSTAVSSNINVSIDGQPFVNYPTASGTVNLTPTGGLSSGTHSLVIGALSSRVSIHFNRLILDTGAVTQLPAQRDYLIEFIGDSITDGTYSYDNGDGTNKAATAQNAQIDYAWLAAESLGADHTQIAKSGACLTNAYPGGDCPYKYGMNSGFFDTEALTYIDPVTQQFPATTNWDFTKYVPDIVVINLGTNDNGRVNANLATNGPIFQNDYTTLLQDIRVKYPSVQILVMRNFKDWLTPQIVNAVNARNQAGDTMVHYVDTLGWLDSNSTDFVKQNWHPSISGYQKAAQLLAPILKQYLPIKANFDDGDLTEWAPTATGTAILPTVVTAAGPTYGSVMLADNNSASGSASITHALMNVSDTMTMKFSFMQQTKSDTFHAYLKDGSTYAVQLYTSQGNLVYRDGNNVNQVIVTNYAANTWYDVKLVLNTATDTYDIYVNNQLEKSGATFTVPATQFTALNFGSPNSAGGTTYVDNVEFILKP